MFTNLTVIKKCLGLSDSDVKGRTEERRRWRLGLSDENLEFSFFAVSSVLGYLFAMDLGSSIGLQCCLP